jgi:hypothetical protein
MYQVEGEDLFATSRGRFWERGGAARRHVGHHWQLSAAQHRAGKRLDAIASGCRALELDRAVSNNSNSNNNNNNCPALC